jgi:hypothetical protein
VGETASTTEASDGHGIDLGLGASLILLLLVILLLLLLLGPWAPSSLRELTSAAIPEDRARLARRFFNAGLVIGYFTHPEGTAEYDRDQRIFVPRGGFLRYSHATSDGPVAAAS